MATFRERLTALLPNWMARAWLGGMGKGYKAGQNNNNSLGWIPYNAKAEQMNTPARRMILAKARDMERNSDILGSILIAYENNVVGTGFKLRMRTERSKTGAILWIKQNNADHGELTA